MGGAATGQAADHGGCVVRAAAQHTQPPRREPTLAELLARLERERARERGDRTIVLFVAEEAQA